ncbi:sulfite exporter TauE/SafE family protein [Hydrogenophaga sp. BPS33]|uniref:sulfite exporter TauE/SafE family protein n=1 Tax=Hydrogenophaga sp. BPS33 TaxID=2651974 RepID=UPI00131FFFD9|nr:sulfite exporter TauE/SafE family protein [Hydrogenophaga sp. BPS33]QHE86265.1 sulfite exporter TauE/SafE family protein [Hydrogenophaga sp. BPS33]
MTLSLVEGLSLLAALLVGLSKGGIPAIGMIAVPLLTLVTSPMKAAVLLLPIFVVSDIVGVWLYRHSYSLENLKILIPAGIAGVVVGWLTASHVPDRALAFLLGAVGIGFCLNVWLRKGSVSPPLAPSGPKGWFWGTLSGFTSFISHAGAPPFQIYLLPQRLPKAVFAGTATIFFAVINAAKIPPYQNLQPYSLESLWSAAALVPAALIGTVLGAYLTRRIADAWFFKLVQVSLFSVSAKVLYDAIWGG